MPEHDSHNPPPDATQPFDPDRTSDVRPDDDATLAFSPTEGNIDETVRPPSMPGGVTRPASTRTPFGDTLPETGQTIEDFELLQELGRGAMGVVYLARQVSLNRQVALKVSKNIGDEAQTMASLEHRHIVQVFSESIIAEGEQRLLCMQFVPGVTLEKLIEKLRNHSSTPMNGQRLLDMIDHAQRGPALLDPDALFDRQLLASSNRQEVVCRLGIWLAEALEYAHRRGVLHRDIKPANILVDPYGHPRLADFSLSARQAKDEDAGDTLFGGTLNYMAPEHLQAFLQEIDQDEVDQRSDIYGLGLVLYELLTLHLPMATRDPNDSMQRHVRRMLDFRRQAPPPLRTHVPNATAALQRALARCLDPNPENRFASAAELAAALRGCLELSETAKSLPRQGRILSLYARWPLWSLIVVLLSPHIAGSVVNISYNNWIVSQLNETQQATFMGLVVVYNLLVYPLCVWAVVQMLVLPALRYKRALDGSGLSTDVDFDAARQNVVHWPRRMAVISGLGWFPGIVFFPLGLQLLSPSVSLEQAAHFVMSITLSGLIALTYSVVGTLWITLRYYYPQLWDQAGDLRHTARRELRNSRWWVWVSQALAGSIPLLGASLFVLVQDKDLSEGQYYVYQVLILWFIILGFGGFQIALTIGQNLIKTIDAMTGRQDDDS